MHGVDGTAGNRPTSPFLRRYSVVQRKSSADKQIESRSRQSGLNLEEETSIDERGKPFAVHILRKSLPNCRSLHRVMSCRGTSFLQQQKTLHSGWLSKIGGWPRTVRQRWFEIKGDQLYYFRSKGDSKPINGIPLPGNRVIRRNADSNHPFQFEIVSGEQRIGKPVKDTHESYIFISSSQSDLEKWVEAINIIIYTPSGGGMFGRAIDQTVRVDKRRGGGIVPIIIEKCVEYLRHFGDDLEEGVFRLSGNAQDVEDLKERFNRGEIVDLISEKHGIHTVASLFKMYLRSLPEPVVPFSFYDRLAKAVNDIKENQSFEVKGIVNLLQQMPRANFNTLKIISRFLHEFQTHQGVTKMTLENLAVVFGPNIISPSSEDPQVLMESSSRIAQVMEFFIKHHAKLFPKTDDEQYYSPKSPGTNPPKLSSGLNLDSTDHPPSADFVKKSATFPRLSRIGSTTSNQSMEETVNGDGYDNSNDYQTQINELVSELDLQRSQFNGQINELENKVDALNKIVAMLKIRLHEEHKARTSAEKRLELYRLGIEEYCQKFGHVNINIP